MGKISTGKLRDGDKVHFNGATVQIQGKPVITIGRDGTMWSWPNMPIVAGRLDFAPEAIVWTIQGNTMCYWRVTRGTK